MRLSATSEKLGHGNLTQEQCKTLLTEAKWPHMVSLNLANTGSGNGLLPDSTTPLTKPIAYNLSPKGVLWHSP